MASETPLLPDEEPLLVELVDAVLDGRPLDWNAAETIASDSQRRLIAHLRSVAAIASFNNPSSPTVASEPTTAPLRATWSHLELLEPIGRGSFATVYRAWDPRLHREVALKLVLAAGKDGESALAEGRLLARVRHPNVVTIHGADRADGCIGLWMELVHGQTLEEIVSREGPLDPGRVIGIAGQLCEALAAVHRAGLVHRDVKAHNVMIDSEGRLVLMDFGTGRSLDQLETGDIAGTPLYLPPETFEGASPTMQGDQYSVAVLLYHLLTGRYPVEGRSLREVHSAHAGGSAQRNVRVLRPDVPARLAAAIARALAPTPSARHATLEAMARACAAPERIWSRPAVWVAATGIAAAIVVALTATSSGRDVLSRMPGGAAGGNVRWGLRSTTPTMRRLDVKGRWSPGALSRDGKYLATVVGGAPTVLDMTTGETRTLRAAPHGAAAEFAIASPDGRSIAYQWWPGGDGPYELRVIDRSGQSDRLIFQADSSDVPWLYEWSRDGSQILVKLSSGNGHRRIALVDVNTRTVRVVQDLVRGDPDLISLSIDNRYVAYDLPDDSTSPPHQSVRIVDTVDGSEHILLSNEQADNRFPLWKKDGRSLFFLSDRSGTPDGWIVPVVAGTAASEPELAARNLGAISPLGLLDNGTLYYDFQAGQFDLYEAALDPYSMTLAGEPHAIRGRRQGSSIGPSYSHDGERLAYLSQHTAFGGKMAKRSIVVRDLMGGEERELGSALEPGMLGPLWSPDDRELLVAASDRANQWGLFVVDAEKGTIEHRVIWPKGKVGSGIRAAWGSDGKAILFGDVRGIVEHQLANGDERVLLSPDRIPAGPGINTFAYGRDGEPLAFTAWNERTAVDVVDQNGGVRELVTETRPRTVTFQSWFPAGGYLLYSRSSGVPRRPDELWRVAVSGGSPQPMGLSVNAITSVNTVAINHAGTAIAYTNGYVQYELWLMENVLSR